MYADDILLYRHIRQASDYQLLQQDVEALGEWANNNYLTFNPAKSKAMVFSRKRCPVPVPSYFKLNGSKLEIVDSVKYLGITISSDLTWSKHINIIGSKARKLVGLLFRQFYRCADTDTIHKLYIAIIRLHLEYASQVWAGWIPICRRTNKHLKTCLYRVCLKRWDLSYPAMLRTLSIPTLAAQRQQLKLCTFFRYVNQLSTAPIAS